jgi:hypothetical protein
MKAEIKGFAVVFTFEDGEELDLEETSKRLEALVPQPFKKLDTRISSESIEVRIKEPVRGAKWNAIRGALAPIYGQITVERDCYEGAPEDLDEWNEDTWTPA